MLTVIRRNLSIRTKSRSNGRLSLASAPTHATWLTGPRFLSVWVRTPTPNDYICLGGKQFTLLKFWLQYSKQILSTTFANSPNSKWWPFEQLKIWFLENFKTISGVSSRSVLSRKLKANDPNQILIKYKMEDLRSLDCERLSVLWVVFDKWSCHEPKDFEQHELPHMTSLNIPPHATEMRSPWLPKDLPG